MLRTNHVFAGICLALSALFLPASVAAQDYYADVRPILTQKCMGCHRTGGPAWSMEDAAETYQRHRRIATAVVRRLMPPWLAEPGHQEYVGDLSLSEEQIELVRRWQDAGFPLGTPAPTPAVQPAAGAAGHAHAFQADVSLEVLPGVAYLPNQQRADDYRCFLVDWPGAQPGYITGFRALPGNREVAHHVVVHAVRPEMAARFRELDTAEEGPGYQCFGGALPDRLGDRAERRAYEAKYPDGLRELNRGSFWLAHWAPGMDGHVFPDGTGIRMEPGSALVVQMHYYAGTAPGERDAGTRVEFRTAQRVARPAFHLPQTRNEWLAGEDNGSMVIAPGALATWEVRDPLDELLPYIARVTGVAQDRIAGLEVHSVNLHMHAFGHSGTVSLTDRFGRRETLLSIPRWDLRWQRDFTLAQPRVFSTAELKGAALTAQCTFRNTRDTPVHGGYGSFDEMCFNFAYMAVRTKD